MSASGNFQVGHLFLALWGWPPRLALPPLLASMHTCGALKAFAIHGVAVTRELQRKAFQSKRPVILLSIIYFASSSRAGLQPFLNYEGASRAYSLITFSLR